MRVIEVGGCVRDNLLGIPSNDVDFAVEAESFQHMRNELVSQGFEIFVENPEFVTIRAKVPSGHTLRGRTDVADFVLCRKDSPTSDGRRPDFVEHGTIMDDLARRDFTVNAIGFDPITEELIDPFDGVRDIGRLTLRFVGSPEKRIEEDGLRVLRGFRFMVTKGFTPTLETQNALESPLAAEMLRKVSKERRREEVNKMSMFDTLASGRLIFGRLPESIQEAIFQGGLRLEPTLKQ